MTAPRLIACAFLALACLVRSAAAQEATAGVGLGLAPRDGGLVVTMVIPGGAAEKAGIAPGAQILEIGQGDAMMIPSSALPPQMFARLLSGPVGSPVTVKSLPAGAPAAQARTDILVRAVVAPSAPPARDPLAGWGEAPGAAASPVDPELPVWAIPRMAPMRTQGSYLVLLPPGYDPAQAYPMVVLLHGSGDNEQAFGKVVTLLGRDGVIYLALRAPMPAIDVTARLGRPSFSAWPFDRPEGSPEWAVARRDYVDWIFDAVADARKAYKVEGDKVSLYGFSQGGGMAIPAALMRPDLVRSAFAEAGSPPPEAALTPQALQQVKAAGVTFRFGHGTEDAVVPPAGSDALSRRLGEADIASEVRLFPGAHTITAEEGAWARAWIDPLRRR
jgi:predicted esterase